MITIVLADDHATLREGLQLILEAQPDLRVVAAAADGRAAVQAVQHHQPAVLIIDLTMPGMNGIEAIHQVRAAHAATQIVVLSMHSAEEYVVRALQAGAQCYVVKGATGSDVINAVRAAAQGRRYFSQSVVAAMVRDDGAIAYDDRLERLSGRERETLQLMVEGKSNNEIASTLMLSPKTIETYRTRLMQKLAISNIPDLVKFAVVQGITSLES